MVSTENTSMHLFLYGTLHKAEVLLLTFGCNLLGTPDSLLNFAIEELEIKDADVVSASGTSHHPTIVAKKLLLTQVFRLESIKRQTCNVRGRGSS